MLWMTHKHAHNIWAKSGALCWWLCSEHVTEMVSATKYDRWRHCVNKFEPHPLHNNHV